MLKTIRKLNRTESNLVLSSIYPREIMAIIVMESFDMCKCYFCALGHDFSIFLHTETAAAHKTKRSSERAERWLQKLPISDISIKRLSEMKGQKNHHCFGSGKLNR